MCVFVHAHAHMYVYACGGHFAIPNHFLRQGALAEPGAHPLSYPGLLAPKDPVVSPHWCTLVWQVCATVASSSTWVLGLTSGPRACWTSILPAELSPQTVISFSILPAVCQGSCVVSLCVLNCWFLLFLFHRGENEAQITGAHRWQGLFWGLWLCQVQRKLRSPKVQRQSKYPEMSLVYWTWEETNSISHWKRKGQRLLLHIRFTTGLRDNLSIGKKRWAGLAWSFTH